MRLATLNTPLPVWNADPNQGILVQVGTMVQVENLSERWVRIHAPGGIRFSTRVDDVYAEHLDYLDEGSPDATGDA